MSEQIVDLMESVMPGPRGRQGPEGPRGLPGVNAVPADEAVASYMVAAGSASRAQLESAILTGALTGGDVVFLGDSITSGWEPEGVTITATWAQRLATAYGWTAHNYARAGQGWNVAGGHNLADQIDDAAKDSGLDAARVKLVFLAAGANDGSSKNLDTVVPATIRKALTTFPNAAVWVVVFPFGSCPLYWTSGQRDAALINIQRGLAALDPSPRVRVIEDAWQWLIGRDEIVAPDMVHPLDAGHRLIANAISTIMQGGSWTVNDSAGVTVGTGWSTGSGQEQFSCRCFDGIAELSGTLTCAPIGGQAERFGDVLVLPRYFRQFPGKRRSVEFTMDLPTTSAKNALRGKYHGYIATPSAADRVPRLVLADHVTIPDEGATFRLSPVSFRIGS